MIGKNILKDVMALDEDNLWAHQKYGYSVPRRNGKTEIAYIAELWGCLLYTSPSPRDS